MTYQAKIGRYRVYELLGNGGMGEVYRGVDPGLEREVAIKLLRPDLASTPEVLERFRAEARTAAKLQHPNVASVYSFENAEGRYLLVMEFVRGKTLEVLLRESGPMAPAEAASLFHQILSGVGHAHDHGIVHRDVKPANVLVTHDGIAKLTDFGIARILGSSRITREGRVIGTFEYMSPERILDRETDHRSDLYSLGIVLFEMLCGKVPFEGQSDFELMRSQVEVAAPPLAEMGVKVPEKLQAAIQKAVEKDPADRFQSVWEFSAALGFEAPITSQVAAYPSRRTRLATPAEYAGMEAWRQGAPLAPPPSREVRLKKGPPPLWALAAASLALAAFLGLGWWILSSEPSDDPDPGNGSGQAAELPPPLPPHSPVEPPPDAPKPKPNLPKPPQRPVRTDGPRSQQQQPGKTGQAGRVVKTITEIPDLPDSPRGADADRQPGRSGSLEPRQLERAEETPKPLAPAGQAPHRGQAPSADQAPAVDQAPALDQTPEVGQEPRAEREVPKNRAMAGPPDPSRGTPPRLLPTPDDSRRGIRAPRQASHPNWGRFWWHGDLKKNQLVHITGDEATSGSLEGIPFQANMRGVKVNCPSPSIEILQQPSPGNPLILKAKKSFKGQSTIACSWRK